MPLSVFCPYWTTGLLHRHTLTPSVYVEQETGALDGRSIWEYDKALGSAIRHYCEYNMAAEEMETRETFLFWFNVSAYSPELIRPNSLQHHIEALRCFTQVLLSFATTIIAAVVTYLSTTDNNPEDTAASGAKVRQR